MMVVWFVGAKFKIIRESKMKKYIKPEFELIKCVTENYITGSATQNGEHNIEFELPNWEDELI